MGPFPLLGIAMPRADLLHRSNAIGLREQTRSSARDGICKLARQLSTAKSITTSPAVGGRS
jgi:hypothetical protein